LKVSLRNANSQNGKGKINVIVMFLIYLTHSQLRRVHSVKMGG